MKGGQMKVKTTKGTITTTNEVLDIITDALKKAAEFEREQSHLYDHDFYLSFAKELEDARK